MANRAAAEALRHLTNTEGWQTVEQYILQRAADSRQRLMDCATWEKVHEHRGEAQALEAVLSYIDQTIREGEEEE